MKRLIKYVITGAFIFAPLHANAIDVCQMMADNASQLITAASKETKDGKLDLTLDPDRDGMYGTMIKVYINKFVKENAGKIDDIYVTMAEEYVYHKCHDTGL